MNDYTARIMSQFRTAGCEIKELEENFEIVPASFPVKTHIYANSHFIQFSTFFYLRPKKFVGRFKCARDAFINEANGKTHLAKLSCDETKFESVWSISCQWKATSGVSEYAYPDEAIEHFITLWLQDIAFVVQNDDSYEVIAMLQKK